MPQMHYSDVATAGELRAVLEDVIAQYGEDTEVTIPRSDGWCVPTHPTLIPAADGATLQLTHDHQ